jgi:uncharacterized membrane protein YcaP (DUF421 family)
LKPTPTELLIIAWHTLIVYVFLIVVIRTIGRRTLSQLSAIDLMVLLLLGSAVETSMVTASTALKGGFVAATVLLVANYLVTRLMLKSKRFRHLVNGGPILLVHDGAVVQENLWRVGFTVSDIKEAMREREIGALSDVRFGVLEPDGRINFVRQSAPAGADPTSAAAS